MAAREERRSFWTWGYVSDEPTQAQRKQAAQQVSVRLGREVRVPRVPAIKDIALRPSRIEIPPRLSGFVRADRADRLTHTYGGHSTELLSALRGVFKNPPDAVAHPRTEGELESALEWCDANRYAAIPYGGGTSVVWGVNVPDGANGAVTIDVDNLNAVLEIDEVSRAGRFQAGILGPDLEAALRPRGLTLRHFPQSFPWSTVGGWVATRSGGHYATNHTHIDDFVESTRMLTPAGWMETRRLPGSGAGPSPDRLVIGSEGTLGIISECWLGACRNGPDTGRTPACYSRIGTRAAKRFAPSSRRNSGQRTCVSSIRPRQPASASTASGLSSSPPSTHRRVNCFRGIPCS